MPAPLTPTPARLQVAHLEPIQARYAEVMEDRGELDAILAKVRWWMSWQGE